MHNQMGFEGSPWRSRLIIHPLTASTHCQWLFPISALDVFLLLETELYELDFLM